MLGKLIKHEFKAGLHSVANIYLAAIAAVGLMAISLAFDIQWMKVIAAIAVIAVAFGLIIVTIISIISNFNKTLFRDQGYLSFTLPVTSGQLLFAKAFCSFCWVLLSYIAVLAIIGAVVFFVLYVEIGEVTIDQFKMILLMSNIQVPETDAILSYVTTLAFVFFMEIVFLVAEIFFAITLSNVRPFQRQSFLPAILIFIVIYAITSITSTFLTAFAPLSLIVSAEGVQLATQPMYNGGMVFGISSVLFQLVMSAFFFGMSGWLMNHKINLK